LKQSAEILSKSSLVDGKYLVQFFIKKSTFSETYRVKDETGQLFFLKIFDLAKLHKTQFDNDGNVKEIESLKNIQHPNLATYKNSGEWIFKNKRYAYLVLGFISGETLAEKLSREQTIDPYEVKRIALGVINGLKYLHGLNPPMLHNHLNHQNVMLDLSGKIDIPKIIDFSFARHFQTSTKVFYREGLNQYYLAPECFHNVFSPQTDLYAVGALMYHLLFGMPPWFADLSEYKKDAIEEEILKSREKPLKIPSLNTTGSHDFEVVSSVVQKALDQNPDNRFDSADEIIKALNGETKIVFNHPEKQHTKQKGIKSSPEAGFGAIAGMNDLKEILYSDVIRALEEKELYESYGLTIPNGLLLYGPPGCGKSFFAEKLAEEAGYNYIEVKPSNLASIYVHGSQEKIGELFSEARKNAPTIINFEEFDALVPKRDGNAGHHQSGEVNEFLSQLNNCGKDGVFVIASTNQPSLIDPAVLRTGRIDKIIYIPPPDFQARKEMFKSLLKNRPVDFGIDYDVLAEKTENYVSVDIKHLIDESARLSLKSGSKITQAILLKVIESTRPSVSLNEIKKYDDIKAQLEGDQKTTQRPSIGFKTQKS